MSAPRAPLFLERQSYRRRRLIDASRAIPVIGIILFLVPLLWPQPDGQTAALAGRGAYVFLAWGALVAATAVISIRLQSRLNDTARPPEDEDVL